MDGYIRGTVTARWGKILLQVLDTSDDIFSFFEMVEAGGLLS